MKRLNGGCSSGGINLFLDKSMELRCVMCLDAKCIGSV